MELGLGITTASTGAGTANWSDQVYGLFADWKLIGNMRKGLCQSMEYLVWISVTPTYS